MLADYVKRILNARVYDVAIKTPLEPAPILSARLDNAVHIKREDLQPVFSFKLRGAYNRIAQLSTAAAERGVIAASAGNHAQGVALAATKRGVKATIVMPRTTPPIKIEAVRRRGGKAVLHGDTYDEAQAHALKLAEERGLTLVHPFDEPEVIAGQGTIARELLDQHNAPDAIFVPVGGGGLIAGIGAYIKYLRPEIKVIGVEPEDAATLHTALAAGKRKSLKEVGLFADGVAVRQIGKETFRVARETVDEVILVSVDEICAAIRDIFDDTRSIAEPAGALAVAGLKRWVEREQASGQELIAIESGANINFDRLRHVAERAEIGEQREALLAVTIPERPGAFREFCGVIGRRPITEFNYRYADASRAHVFAGIGLADGPAERQQLVENLFEAGYEVADLTDNDMAKIHIRYMVGGRAGADIDNEVLYRFQFPERPGALLQFLQKVGKRWNISLFHYRNHGSAYGRVLVGLQIPSGERGRFRDSMDRLGYPCAEESTNPAYRLFLGR